jgi:dynactin complex subunit
MPLGCFPFSDGLHLAFWHAPLKVGVELDEPVGKNNGTVNGVAYFTCPESRGLLCHPKFVLRVRCSLLRANIPLEMVHFLHTSLEASMREGL